MNRILTLAALLYSCSIFAQTPTESDLSFNSQGYLIMNYSDEDYGTDVLVDGDDIICSVASLVGNLQASRILRFNEDGTPDTNFGNNGELVLTIPGGSVSVSSMAWDQNGNILLTGYGSSGPFGADVYLARVTPSGALDPSFGTNGEAMFDLGGVDIGRDLYEDDNGDILVCGYSNNNGYDGFLLKATALGALSPTFGTGGVSISPFPAFDLANRIAHMSNTAYVLGTLGDTTIVTKFDEQTGAVDPNFGNNGTKTIVLNPNGTNAEGLAITAEEGANPNAVIVASKEVGTNNSGSKIRKLDAQVGIQVAGFDSASDMTFLVNEAEFRELINRFGKTWIAGTNGSGFGLIRVVDPNTGQWLALNPDASFEFEINGQTVEFNRGKVDAQGRIVTVGSTVTISDGLQSAIVNRILPGTCEPTGIEESELHKLQASVFPNPTDGPVSVQLELTEHASELVISVVDIQGRTVSERTLRGLPAGSHYIALEETNTLPAGPCLLTIRMGQTLRSQEFIKQ